MQNHHLNLGEPQSTHRPPILGLIFLAVCFVPLLMASIAGALYSFYSISSIFTGRKGGAFDKGADSFICLGVACLLLALVGGFLVSEFRRWYATRTVKLSIYQQGFTYESQGQIKSCRWEEIKHINFRSIEVSYRSSPSRKARVIRSVETKDGEVIGFAQTLKLVKITGLITSANKEYRKRMGIRS